MKILFTSVGRRVELIQCFRSAAQSLHQDLVIYGTDISENAPALKFCDKPVITCRIKDEKYIPQLLALCEAEKIDALIPTIDTDLLLLAQNRERFLAIGTRVAIGSESAVKICRDKRRTAEFFLSCGLDTPVPVDDYKKYRGGYPAFIKPLDGSSSINAFGAGSYEELAELSRRVGDYIVQPFIEGDEYTADVFCNIENGKCVYITPRRRLQVRSGEVLKTRIVNDEKIVAECRKIAENFFIRGAFTVQLIREKNTGKDYFIEINPRFGGGAPLSMKAGADSAKELLSELSGKTSDFCKNAAVPGTEFSRFDQCVITARPEEHAGIRAVIFDLDDTLFNEIDYVRSGYRAVAKHLKDVSGAYEKLCEAFFKGRPAIDAVLQAEGLYSEEKKAECVRIYRTHLPDISLSDETKELLSSLRNKGIKIGIVTDGRPEGQRAKIEALGLKTLTDEIVITDEIGGKIFRKPCDIAYRIIQKKLNVPFEQCMYVGDNPEKDFKAPLSLSMAAVYFKNPRGLYSGKYGGAAENGIVTISALPEILRML